MEIPRKKSGFSYPHPLVRELNVKLTSNFKKIPPFYSFYEHTNSSIPSSKIIRATHLRPVIQKQFSLLVQPFHPGQEIPTIEHSIVCSFCSVYINPYTKIINQCQFQCNFCKKINQHSSLPTQIQQNNAIYDLILKQQKEKQKLLFVIQASENLYNLKVIDSIRSFIETFSENQNVEFGFIFYDLTKIYFLNIEDSSFNIVTLLDDLDEFPIHSSYMFKIAKKINENQIFSLIAQFLYECFIVKQTNLNEVRQYIIQVCKKITNISCKFFLTILNSKTALSQHSEQVTQSGYIDYFLISPKVSYNNAMAILGKGVFRIYNSHISTFEDIYYDLYHNYQLKSYVNTEIEIKTTKGLSVSSKTQTKFNKLTTNTIITIDLSGKNQLIEDIKQRTQQSVQIIIRHKQNSRIRIINYKVSNFTAKNTLTDEINHISDESYCYNMIRKLLQGKQEKIKTELTSLLKTLSTISVEQKENIGMNKNLVYTFLYTFLANNHDFMNCNAQKFVYSRHLMLNQGLQTFSKMLYPRTYQFDQSGMLVNARSIASKFEHEAVLLIQNGKILYLVLGSELDKHILSQLFGTTNLSQIKKLTELPQYENNAFLRDSIQLIRLRNQLYFLPLKIIIYGSFQYEKQISRYLYSADEHKRFFNEIWFDKKKIKK